MSSVMPVDVAATRLPRQGRAWRPSLRPVPHPSEFAGASSFSSSSTAPAAPAPSSPPVVRRSRRFNGLAAELRLLHRCVVGGGVAGNVRVERRLDIVRPVLGQLDDGDAPPHDSVIQRNVALHSKHVPYGAPMSAGRRAQRGPRLGPPPTSDGHEPSGPAASTLSAAAAPFVPSLPGSGREPLLQRLVGETPDGVPLVQVPFLDISSHKRAMGSRRRSRAARILKHCGYLTTPLPNGLYLQEGDGFGHLLAASPPPRPRRLPFFERLAPRPRSTPPRCLEIDIIDPPSPTLSSSSDVPGSFRFMILGTAPSMSSSLT